MTGTKHETLRRTRIIGRLRSERRGFWTVIHGGAYQARGIPDIVGCYQGRYVGLEVKEPDEQADPLQAHRIEQIIRAGGIAGVITSYEEAEALLDA